MAETVNGLQDVALTWSGRALDVGAIEAELGKLRYMAAGEPAGGDGVALRTSLLNMVVYAEHEESAAHAGRVIEDLAGHHPSRALIVIARPSDGESHIEAQLSAHCHTSSDIEQSVCCEEVTLRVSGRAAAHLHSVIIPLLIPDLPVYVWWTEGLPEDRHLFLQLLGNADRLIVDSGRFGRQPQDMLALAELLSHEERPGAGDLTWTRLLPWREILDRQQSIAEMRHHLASVKSVELRYAKGHGHAASVPALLFLAWLAGQFGWDTASVSAHGRSRLTLRAGERTVSAYLHGVDYPEVEPGELAGVKIACQSETARALLSISRTGDPYHLTVRTEHRGGASEDNLRIEPPGASDLLMRELDTPPRDAEYRRVLRAAAPLIAAIRA